MCNDICKDKNIFVSNICSLNPSYKLMPENVIPQISLSSSEIFNAWNQIPVPNSKASI